MKHAQLRDIASTSLLLSLLLTLASCSGIRTSHKPSGLLFSSIQPGTRKYRLHPSTSNDQNIYTLVIVSGNHQIGPPNQYWPKPLVVSLKDSKGHGITDAPVIFHVTSGGGFIQAPYVRKIDRTATVLTDGTGQALVYYLLSSALNVTSEITVSTNAGKQPQSLQFTGVSDDSTGKYTSPFAPSDCVGSVNGDGSLILTWTNSTLGTELYITVEQQQVDGSWRPISPKLPPGTTTYTITSPKGSGPYRVDPYTPDPPGN